MDPLKCNFLLNMLIFHCYLNLPEGNIAMKHPSFFHYSCQDRRTTCSIAMFDFTESYRGNYLMEWFMEKDFIRCSCWPVQNLHRRLKWNLFDQEILDLEIIGFFRVALLKLQGFVCVWGVCSKTLLATHLFFQDKANYWSHESLESRKNNSAGHFPWNTGC